MTVSDWTGIVVGSVLIVQGWQQNRIFERQNRIIAKDLGVPVPANASVIRLARYWPTLVNVVLAISIFAAVAYDHLAPARPIGAIAIVVPWAFVIILACGIAYTSSRSKTDALGPSKLTIHNAIYRAPSGKGDQYDVTDCLRRMIVGDHLVLQIENGNFVVEGKNFVPKDPFFGELKWLHVEYSYDAGSPILIECPEHSHLLLPEDSRLKETAKRLAEELEALRKEHQAAQREYLELKRAPNLTGLFTPLQIEAFQLAKDLRDFLDANPFPSDAPRNPGESDAEYLPRLYTDRGKRQAIWRAKLGHDYVERKFGERITAVYHRAGEEAGYEVYLASYGDKPPQTQDDLREWAQRMEMMAIYVNRKERNEVDLLHPKS